MSHYIAVAEMPGARPLRSMEVGRLYRYQNRLNIYVLARRIPGTHGPRIEVSIQHGTFRELYDLDLEAAVLPIAKVTLLDEFLDNAAAMDKTP